MTVDTLVRRGYPIFFSFVVAFSIIELAISGWLVARFNHNHNYRSLGERDRVRYFLFVSAWTTLLLPILMFLFMVARNSALASVLTHIIFLFITWVLWLTASAALTQSIGGGLNCSADSVFVYCNQLNALAAFGWITWIFLTIALFLVLLLGIRTVRRGDGYGGSLIAV